MDLEFFSQKIYDFIDINWYLIDKKSQISTTYRYRKVLIDNIPNWYLNWPHWTFLSWDVVHWHELGGVHMRGGGVKKILKKKIFFRFPGKSTSEKTFPLKKIGIRRCLGELGVSKGPKTKWGVFYFFFAFRV
jgi:hypothetical protein